MDIGVVLVDKICVGGFREMRLTETEVRALPGKLRRYSRSVGDSLYVLVEPVKGSGGKSFVGKMRSNGKQIDVRIGVFGKGPGQWTLKAARDEWFRLRSWYRETGRDPRELQKDEKRQLVKQSSDRTLNELVDSYLIACKTKYKQSETTIKDKKNKLSNEIIPALGGSTPVSRLGWDEKSKGRTGREAVFEITDSIEKRGSLNQARKVLGVMRHLFDYAIERGWMERGQNPAVQARSVGAGHEVQHNPCLSWDELPQLLDDLNRNKGNGSQVVLAAIKLDLMTFLRVGSLVPMRWDEVDYAANLWTVPGSRMKSGKNHWVPLTDPIKDLLAHLRKINGEQEYVFWSPRGRSKPHIDESALNQHLKVRLGYGGRQTAHGLRSLPLTAGQEVLKFSAEVIQRQMDHAVGDKVRQAYDKSQLLDERWQFMRAWCDALLDQGLEV